MVLGAALAVLAAASNAAGSVLQRRASRDRTEGSTAWRALVELLRRPGWSAGIAAHVVGFVLQGVALGFALITIVQPLLVAELPFTLILSALVFRAPLSRRAWAAVAITAAGLSLFLFSLSPTGGHPLTTPVAARPVLRSGHWRHLRVERGAVDLGRGGRPARLGRGIRRLANLRRAHRRRGVVPAAPTGPPGRRPHRGATRDHADQPRYSPSSGASSCSASTPSSDHGWSAPSSAVSDSPAARSSWSEPRYPPPSRRRPHPDDRS